MPFQIVKLVDPITNQVVIIPSGLVPRGAYNGATDYSVGDAVSYNGSSYVMYVDAVAGTLPTDTSYWMLLAAQGSGGGATVFTDLTDVPGDYTGYGGYKVKVKSTEDGLEFLPDTGGAVVASDVTISKIGTATYDQLQEVHDLTRSAGHLDGGEITDAGSEYIAVSAGKGFIRAVDDDTSTLYTFDWVAPSNIAIPTDSIQYVYVDYNGGSPVVGITSTENYDYRTSFPIGYAINEGGTLYINDTPHSIGRFAGRILRQHYETDGRIRADELGGLIISESGTRNLEVTTGVTWLRGVRSVFSGLDTSVSGTFDRYYRDSPSGWIVEAGETQVPNDNYDDGSGTLAPLTNNRYGVRWFYLGPSSGIVMVYGRGNYTSLSLAEAETPPPDLPLRLQVGSLLLGRMVYLKGAASASSVSTSFEVTFNSASVADHGNLAGLADDDHTQYQLRSEKSAASGYPSLDSGGRLPMTELTYHNHQAGIEGEPAITDYGDGTFSVAGADVWTFDDASRDSMTLVHMAGGTPLSPTDDVTNYLCADRDANDWALLTDITDIDYLQYVPYLVVFKRTGSNNMHFQKVPLSAHGEVESHHQRIVECARYDRPSASLIGLAVDSSLNITLTGGGVWAANYRYSIPDVTTATRQFKCEWTGAAWSITSNLVPVINNTQYNGASGYATLTDTYWTINYIYRGIEDQDHIYTVLGTEEYATSALAQASKVVASIPDIISSHSIFIGRAIVQKSATTGIISESAFDSSFSGSASITDHGQLSGLSDYDHPQYQATSASTNFAVNSHSHGVTLNLTNINGTTSGDSNGIVLSLSAGAGGAGDGWNPIAAGGSTANSTQSIIFSNSNGISFSLNGSTITASHNALTTAALSNHSHGNPTLNLTNLAGTTGSNSAGFTLSLSATAQSQQPMYFSASNSNTSANTLQFGNSNGISWSVSNGSLVGTVKTDYLTTAANSTHSHGNPTLALTNLSGTTASASNGLTLSLSAGNYLTTAANSTHSHGNPTLALTNLSGTTASASNGLTLSLSAAAPGAGGGVAIAASNSTTYTSGTVAFAAGANITLNTNGQTISIVGPTPGAGGAVSQRWMELPNIRFSLSNLTNITALDRVPFFIPFFVGGTLTVSRGNWEMSRSTSGSNAFSVTMGVFTYNNSTQLGLLTSFSGNFSNTATASVSGIRRFAILASQSFSLSPGGYVFGMMFSQANSASMNYSIRGYSGAVQAGAVVEGTDQYNTATSYNIFPFYGRLSATSAAFPESVGDSQVRGQFSAASSPIGAWIGLNAD